MQGMTQFIVCPSYAAAMFQRRLLLDVFPCRGHLTSP